MPSQGATDGSALSTWSLWSTAIAGVSLAWSVASTSLAYHLWLLKSKKDAVLSHDNDSKSGVGNQKRRCVSPHFWEPNLLLALGAGCASLVLKNFSKANHRTAEWLVWGCGFIAVQRAMQHRDRVNEGPLKKDRGNSEDLVRSKRREHQQRDSAFWPLLYTALFPVPLSVPLDSQQQGPWLLACLLVCLQVWKQENNGTSSGIREDEMDATSPNGNVDDVGASQDTGAPVDTRHRPTRHQQENRETLGLPPICPREKPSEVSLPVVGTGTSIMDSFDMKNIVTSESTARTDDSGTASTVKRSKRFLEILVHNISHKDFVLGLDAPSAPVGTLINGENKVAGSTGSNEECFDEKESELGAQDKSDPHCLCRPHFSFFDHYCRAVRNNMTEEETIVSFPRYQRSIDDPRYSVLSEPSNTIPIPTGLALCSKSPVMADLSQVRVRGRDNINVAQNGGEAPSNENCHETSALQFPISHVFFPLLATLLPRWENQTMEKYRWRGVKRVLILVTGVGTPRNWTHSVTGNSTQACADIMENFVHRIDPSLVVVKIHSETNIFRYDENLVFVQQELMPVLDAYRDAHTRGLPYPDEQTESGDRSGHGFDVNWRQSLSVTLSFADGSPARAYAIQAGLRQYRPTFFHFWYV